jgi:hypothetical protein
MEARSMSRVRLIAVLPVLALVLAGCGSYGYPAYAYPPYGYSSPYYDPYPYNPSYGWAYFGYGRHRHFHDGFHGHRGFGHFHRGGGFHGRR